MSSGARSENGNQVTFNFMGPVHLVAQEFPASKYVPNALYVHLFEWPDMFNLDGMRVDRLRVAKRFNQSAH